MLFRSLAADLRFGTRILIKSPGFTITAVLSLGLGIGANAAIFSVVDSLLLRPLPYGAAERLVVLRETFRHRGNAENPVAPANYFDWRERSRSFEGMAAYSTASVSLTGGADPEKVTAVYSTDDFLVLFGIQADEGRLFQPGDVEQVGALRVAVISHGLWLRRFGGRREIVGTEIRVDGYPLEVVGILPADFRFPAPDVDLWMPTTMATRERSRDAHYLNVVGRLRESVSVEQAQLEMDSIADRLSEEFPEANRYIGTRVKSLREELVGDVRPALLVLLGATGLVLLIACANIANLLMARGVDRRREIAIRLAMGSGRWRLVRQLLIESLSLSVLGGIAGLFSAAWCVPLLSGLSTHELLQPGSVSIDLRMLLYTLAMATGTGLFFGIAPAAAGARQDIGGALTASGRGLSSSNRGWLRDGLVVAEIACALVLVVGAGLLANSFVRLTSVDTGFDSRGLLTMEVYPPYSKYPDAARRFAFYDRILSRLETLPGVESAAVATALPTKGTSDGMLYLTESASGLDRFSALPRTVSEGYFETLGIPLAAGRSFSRADGENAPGVVVINQTMARLAWPGAEPLGKRMKMGVETMPWLTVIGVARDIRLSPGAEAQPQVYMHVAQTAAFGPHDLVVKTAGPPLELVAAVRESVWAVDSEQPLSDIQTMGRLVSLSLGGQRFNTVLLSLFAALALTLSAVGIYGVVSYAVTRSTREIGIRLALGAQAGDVMRMVVGRGLVLTAAGLGMGTAAAFGLTRLLAGMLYAVSTTDAATFAAAAVLLTACAVLSCLIPARRAMRVDPIVALRLD